MEFRCETWAIRFLIKEFVLPTEKTKNPEQIDVYTVQQKGVRKRVVKTTLGAFWKKDSVIRINNVDDKQETPNSEKDIRAKVTIATKLSEVHVSNSSIY